LVPNEPHNQGEYVINCEEIEPFYFRIWLLKPKGNLAIEGEDLVLNIYV